MFLTNTSGAIVTREPPSCHNISTISMFTPAKASHAADVLLPLNHPILVPSEMTSV